MAGLIAHGQGAKNSALQAMQRYSSMDAKLQSEQEAMADAEQQQRNTLLTGAAGAGLGYALGTAGSVGGPIGMAIGFGVGGLLGSLF